MRSGGRGKGANEHDNLVIAVALAGERGGRFQESRRNKGTSYMHSARSMRNSSVLGCTPMVIVGLVMVKASYTTPLTPHLIVRA